MIVLTGILRCATQAEADIVRRLLPEHTRLTHAETGCLAFAVTVTDDPLIWRVEEQFSDRETFAAHQQRTRASAWGEATRAIVREYEITEVNAE
ncbi:putative quinol monooxygenase [Duffyella gerundensis]|uniref:putative quinol monooxygenase n=1 Tax=Duffyella gerundensis TaxID=1619313 RepID=UPI001654ACE5|nr:antibiotic biosynthesis monooxygenase [Duffyella gerundensis]